MSRFVRLLTIVSFTAITVDALALCQPEIGITGQLGQSNDTIFTCVNFPLQIQDESLLDGLVTTRVWSFGDGSNAVDGLLSNVTDYTYTEEGIFEMTLTVESALCPQQVVAKTVVVLGQPQFSVSSIDANCEGSCDGKAIIELTGLTTSQYHFIWSDSEAQQTDTAFGLCVGSYFAVIADNYGCTDMMTNTVEVLDPLPLIGSFDSSSEADCHGNNTGAVEVNATGGTEPYEFELGSVVQVDGHFSNLFAGSYTVNIVDDNGCLASVPVTVDEPDELVGLFDSGSDVDCFGNATGSAIVVASGGIAPYTFDIGNGPQADGNFTGLSAGPYTVGIDDDNGCHTNFPVTIIQPDTFIVSFDSGSEIQLCPSSGDVQLDLSFEGGVTPYSADWPSSPDLVVLSEATAVLTPNEQSLDTDYVISVTDFNGCEASDTITVNSTPSSLQGTISMGGLPCINCEVYRYKYHPSDPGVWQVVGSVTTNVVGQYDFGQVDNFQSFILMADPDEANYPMSVETFYPQEYDWNNATVFNMCGNDFVKDIDMIEPMVFNGNNTLSGTVYYSASGKTQTEEDPIPLIDVVVEKTPPGQATGRIATNSNGEYEFSFVPNSDTAYTIFVNIPGVPVTNTYEILATTGGQLFDHLDFCLNIDSTAIETCTVEEELATTEPQDSYSENFVLYPNPSNGMFTIETGKFAETESEIRIIDPSGRLVFQKQYPQTPYVINMVNVAEGYYMVQIMNQKHSDASPISVMHY